MSGPETTTFEGLEEEFKKRSDKALAMGGPAKLAARHAAGLLNARERIDHLADPDSFTEFGLFAQSAREADRDRTPGDGKISGLIRIGGRSAAVVSNDFTVMGASSATTNGRKVGHVKDMATRRGLPIVFLGESTGARMPDVMGARGIGAGDRPTQYRRMRETPWASAVLGHCYGSSSWYAALSDFVVMRKGAVMAVSSVKLTSMAISERMEPEDLGGWRMHTDVTGMVDAAVDTDEEALDLVRKFLSYLPSHHQEAPPREAPNPDLVPDASRLQALLPLERTRVYDMRKILDCIVDRDSRLELKSRYAKNIVTCLARIGGRVVGIIANNPLHKGGAIDVDACEKATSFIVLCDSFNIPLLFFVDQPGFLIGIEGERRGAVGRVMNWMNALSLVTVPKFSVIVRKTYGQAVLNMGGGGNSDVVLMWPSAEVNFMDPRHAVTIVHGVRREEDPERYDALLADMAKETSAYEMASPYNGHIVVLPEKTRDTLGELLDSAGLGLTAGVGEHLMRTWPTSY
ncbi:MAG: carboxyl transferase domain-containing protein [Ottowia sp.]|uniref:acyl-CoA carboxylase subunit beta n=1 Tax=Ottowia sp. TaxID=1898956 RepID=UPI003C74338B